MFLEATNQLSGGTRCPMDTSAVRKNADRADRRDRWLSLESHHDQRKT